MFGPTITPPTQKCKKYVGWQKIFIFVSIAIGIAQAIILKDFFSVINTLMGAMILWCAYKQINYCMLMIFLLYTIFPMMTMFFMVGSIFQDYQNKFDFKDKTKNIKYVVIGFVTIINNLVGKYIFDDKNNINFKLLI